ncbi:hypothetical protein [Paenibacillus sp. FSL L8-0709]|uniref:hypothetical protein n=1 Tax=Paenibacillus sp. FSL L8-0709 TaxID=2975312 RepID=UPI0030FBE422
MGNSCAFYSDTIDHYRLAMDNLVMAKKLHDLGRDLPDNYVFTIDNIANREESFFLLAVDLLTACEIEVIEDNGFEFSFKLELPEAIQWFEIESTYPEAEQDREWILEPLTDEPEDDLLEECTFTINIQLLQSGLEISVSECSYFYFLFEKLCDSFSRLQQKISEWTK